MQLPQGEDLQPCFQRSFIVSQHDANKVPSQYPFASPFQQSLHVSQPGVIRSASQLPWSYEMPLSTTHVKNLCLLYHLFSNKGYT